MCRGIHKRLRAILARKGDSLPDGRRSGHNLSYRLSDALICAFCIFFFQHPSALAFQRQMQEKRRRNNIASIFGVEEIPSDTQIKTLLDRIEPDAFGGVFDDSLRAAEERGALDSYRVLDDGVLIALDGVWYHSSEKISCKRCLHVTKGDRTTYYHTILAATIVKPGDTVVLPVMGEPIGNDDGLEKQDCELNAAKRWLRNTPV